MAERYSFRHVRSAIGAFVLVALALAVGVVFLAGRNQHWFQKRTRYVVLLPSGGLFGVHEGSEVEIMGSVAGAVQTIEVRDDDSMRAGIAIRGDFARFVRVGSKAILKRKLVSSQTYIEITRGPRPEPLEEGSEMVSEPDRAVLDELTDTVQQIRAEVTPAIQEIRLAAAEFKLLAADLRDPKGDLHRVMQSVGGAAAGADQGGGVIGRLLHDRTWADQVDGTLRTAGQTLEQVRAQLEETARITNALNKEMLRVPEFSSQSLHVLKETDAVLTELKASVARLPPILDTIHGETQAMPGLVIETQQTIREIHRLIEGLQRHWLVRSYIEPDVMDERISPASLQPSGGR